MPLLYDQNGAVAFLAFNDPDRRNALGVATFDELDRRLESIADDGSIAVLVLGGRGKAFCAGFDLTAAIATPEVLETFILRLSGTCRMLRRMPQVVIGAVQGMAVAGGCAIVSACDLVLAAPSARFGYPVHRIGVSPAVSAPTLSSACGSGPARRLQLGGELIGVLAAQRTGLVSRLASSDETLGEEAAALAEQIAGHGHAALRATKAWLNELDGSNDDDRFDRPALDTAREAIREDSVELLRRVWRKKP